MERGCNSSNRSLKIMSRGRLVVRDDQQKQQLDESSSSSPSSFTWPRHHHHHHHERSRRSGLYVCSFCRRDFSSAQALGGHMNVHRRDRATLLLSSSSSSNPIQLPPPPPSPPSSFLTLPAVSPSPRMANYDHPYYPILVSTTFSSNTKPAPAPKDDDEEDKQMVSLELGIGCNYQDAIVPVLDLELRLRCST